VATVQQHAGGLFLPLRAGSTGYGGGRYLLDTPKVPTSVGGRDGLGAPGGGIAGQRSWTAYGVWRGGDRERYDRHGAAG
jgi:hypothetical protein